MNLHPSSSPLQRKRHFQSAHFTRIYMQTSASSPKACDRHRMGAMSQSSYKTASISNYGKSHHFRLGNMGMKQRSWPAIIGKKSMPRGLFFGLVISAILWVVAFNIVRSLI
jgi:hypothetical protein